MADEIYPTVEKQAYAAGVGFKVLSDEPMDSWKTNYAYYLAQKAKGEAVRPLIGRYVEEDGKEVFQVYQDGDWVADDFWNYAEPILDKEGKPIMNARGKPKTRPYFQCKKVWLLEFVKPVKIQFYDKELKQTVTEERQTFYVALSENLSKKLVEQMSDPRNGNDPKFVIKYDSTAMPVDQYKVQYYAE
jgi:hypothetical protein